MPLPAAAPSAPSPATDPSAPSPAASRLLDAEAWRARATAHAERADELTRVWREHRARHEPHAIEDFLFTYYSVKPAALRRWHPGAGVALAGAAPGVPGAHAAHAADTRLAPAEPGTAGPPANVRDDPEPAHADRAGWRWHRVRDDGAVELDAAAFVADRGSTVGFVEELARRILDRQPRFGCFGLHEWAMVYRDDEHRHPVPLRLGQRGTDEVVEAHTICCTHFDAFRFFTPEARPRNTLQPARETQPAMEQAGCLHANMDVYKWATKLGPAVPGGLLLDAFELARDIRWTDMQASPYDVAAWGVPPIAIETPAGKVEYAALQRGYAERAQALRRRLLDAIAVLRATAAETAPAQPTA